MSDALDYLPEFLLLATFVTGILWLLDRYRWRPRREAAAAELEARTPPQQRESEGYRQAREALLREPAAMEWGGSFFPVLAVVLVLRSFVVEPFVIPSGSMIPTLEVGDYILVNKFTYGLRLPVVRTEILDLGEPDRGDVMVFFPPHLDRYFIKRVIGLPGDHIRYEDKRLTVNGEAVPLEYLGSLPPEDPQVAVFEETLGGVEHRVWVEPRRGELSFEHVVPAGHYFMMGDNRDRSQDSRYWGDVPERNIVGRAFAIWMHKEPGLSWPSFERVGTIR